MDLHDEDASAIVPLFSVSPPSQGQIDVTEQQELEIRYISDTQEHLALVVHEPEWTEAKLVSWLDKRIKHPDVTKPSATVFATNAIKALIQDGNTLDELARHKSILRNSLSKLIDALRAKREQSSFAALFAGDAELFETSANLALVFDEQSYGYNQPYSGTYAFNKHYFQNIGDLKSEGEEFECAVHLDQLDEVQYWLRNVDRKPNSFWLQLPEGRFYPDFVAMLKDGRYLVVEYKGQHLYEFESDKLTIGKVWAERSGGRCLFCMPTNKDYALIDKTIAGI